jgi:hypothetical protein
MKKINQNNYERASQTLGRLFDIESDIAGQINTGISHNGIRGFFKNLDIYEFSKEDKEKLLAVRRVLFGTKAESMPKYLLEEYMAISDAGEGGGIK